MEGGLRKQGDQGEVDEEQSIGVPRRFRVINNVPIVLV